jgi:hypothetical protein
MDQVIVGDNFHSTLRQLLVIAIMMGAPAIAGAQSLKQAVIETKTGGYLVFTNDKQSFLIHLDTAIIEPYEDQSTMYLAIDKKNVLQLFTIPFQNPDSKDLTIDENKKKFLADYMKYETAYFRSELKLSLENLKTKWGIINLRRFLHWQFDTPEFETVTTQIHLTTICFDYFLNINVPVSHGLSYDEAFAFIQYVASRVQVNDYPIDLEAFAKEVNGL